MKKYVALVGVFIMLLAVTGCLNTSDDLYYSGDDQSAVQADEVGADENQVATEIAFEQMRTPATGDILVTLNTNYGAMTFLMLPEVAPKAVENFVTHAKEGYFDGLIFHRVIDDFMIQGGDPTGTGTGGESIWGQAFEDEFLPGYFPFGGSLCMANSGQNTNGSQFFVVEPVDYMDSYYAAMKDGGFPETMLEAYKELGGTPWLYGQHTVFGQIQEGVDVLHTISSVPTTNDRPDEDVVIESATVIVVD